LFAQDFDNLDAGEPLDQEIGGAVVTFLAGAYDADGGDTMGRLELPGSPPGRLS